MMKNFRVSGNNFDKLAVDPWAVVSRDFTHASDVINYLESRNYFDGNFDIEQQSPVTDEYGTLISVEKWKITYINRYLKLPTVFERLIKKINKNSIKKVEAETEEENNKE